MLAAQTGVTLATTGALLSAALAGVCAGFLPHNFYPARLFMGDSGSMLIGLVLSACALTLTGQFTGTDIAVGRATACFVAAAAAAAAGLDPDGAARRPGAGRRTPHPGRPLAVRPGQAAPAPPAAGDRPLPAPRGADHVAVGRADRRSAWCSPASTAARRVGLPRRHVALTVALTFVLPVLGERPATPRGGATGRFGAVQDFVIVFTSGPELPTAPHTDDPPQDGRRHDDRVEAGHPPAVPPCSSGRAWRVALPSSRWLVAWLVDGATRRPGALVGGGSPLAVFVLGIGLVHLAAGVAAGGLAARRAAHLHAPGAAAGALRWSALDALRPAVDPSRPRLARRGVIAVHRRCGWLAQVLAADAGSGSRPTTSPRGQPSPEVSDDRRDCYCPGRDGSADIRRLPVPTNLPRAIPGTPSATWSPGACLRPGRLGARSVARHAASWW